MSFTESITLELIKAILAGSCAAAVFVFGQSVQRFLFEPVSEMRRLIGQIGHDLIFYSNIFSQPQAATPEEWDKATSTYRVHASSLQSLPLTIPFYDHVAKPFCLPSRQQTREASSCFIGISNMSLNPSMEEFTLKRSQVETIRRALNIPDAKGKVTQ